MQRQRSAVLAALLAGTAVCSVPRPRVAVWRPPPSRGVHHDPYGYGETVSSVNTNTESVSENGSQVITESVNNSPVTTETNEETNDDNDVITNP
ncbi:hypothetical protein FJT64_008257 [Amphibalanus amphitrite]|uniref:Secreted protein n=1 Tax=Amphibalanus amphitrite TaxID=1232801 RepID=A0A6A4VR57_AMPAM|nr:hypothetical protein FJT64_008257 [Amphibalanus amphitrite]